MKEISVITGAIKIELAITNPRLRVVGIYPGGIDTSFWDEKKSGFMNPNTLAKTIVANLTTGGLIVKELVIDRIK